MRISSMPSPRYLLPIVAFLLLGCGGSDKSPSSAGAEGESEFHSVETSPEERRFLDYGNQVAGKVAARDYLGFFNELSSQARARMSVNQFAPAEDDAVFERNERAPRVNPRMEDFQSLVAMMEKERGQPARVLEVDVFSTDPDILAGRKKEKLDALEIMMAIGNMPDEIPAESRRASLRAHIGVTLPAAEMEELAKRYSTTPEKLATDPDFSPALTLKLVLVEEGGELKVGYFEFLPPSMWD